jgi:hypothetical protein
MHLMNLHENIFMQLQFECITLSHIIPKFPVMFKNTKIYSIKQTKIYNFLNKFEKPKSIHFKFMEMRKSIHQIIGNKGGVLQVN